MDNVITSIAILLSTTLMYSTPLIFASLGGVFSENSGVVNIGLEGMMTIGAFAGAATAVFTGNPWMAFVGAGLAGGLFALLHAIACISFNANQVISGIAINFLAPGIAVFISKILFDGSTMTPSIPLDQKMPRYLNGLLPKGFFDTVFNTYATTYIAFILVAISWFVLYKTRFGLRIRAVGEHPRAADTLGINVHKVRYICVILSGILAGFGGASMSLAIVSTFRPTLISGQGFIALAAMIFGKWKPQGAMLASLLFGFANGLVVFLGSPAIGIDFSEQLLSMIPYVITLFVLIFFVGQANGPAANGEIYEKGER